MDKIKALIEAVEWHNSGKTIILPIYENTIQVGVPSDLDGEQSDWGQLNYPGLINRLLNVMPSNL